MPTKRYSTEQIVSKLRQAEVELSRGLRVPLVCKKLGISEQTYYRWRKEYGGLRLDQAKRLKELERENTRLKQRCFRHQLLLPRPYLVLTKPLRLDIQCQRGASVKIGWKYLDD